ncbi:RagB/SusD family nutrient uptake outer membrane protein [Telluribacter humicola]|uniref:RagB/SusD family nutrient uptake outer membrane protein n=1 Tax=Telluribacter humicola TaxID=1720261 RepID=UPI001A96124D|nr:RagB/SusD family nutrient uptake outer membrane protein [Telluribacter humicola]
MKKKIIVAFLATLSLTACREEFLDLTPVSTTSTNNFFKTQADMVTAINAAYAILQAPGQYGNYYIVAEIPSDNTTPVLSGSVTDQDEFDKFYIRTTNPVLLERWNDGYKGIYRTNTILDRIGSVNMNEELKIRITGEAKFLRALMYFNLVRVFGDVPLVLKEISDPAEGYEYGRAPVTEVYAQIVKDLSDAEKALPASYTGADIGRATSGAAKALLGKVYLTNKQYAEAAAKLKEVIDSGQYALLPNYANVFNAANKNHRESIFDVQYKKGLVPREGSGFANAFAPENSGNAVVLFGGGGNNRPTPDMEQAYEAGDVRKNVSMATNYVNAAGNRVDYYFVKKYLDTPVVSGDSDDNWPVLRYADVLLMYAEALNELGRTAEALPYLNQVRTRAGLSAVSITGQQEMRLAIEEERRVELAFEGHRWFDLVRTGRALPVLKAKAAAIGIKTDIDQDNLIWPIPQSQIDINKTKIQQNPGY